MAKSEVNEQVNEQAVDQVKPIVIKDIENGIDYTLEFNRESVRFAEARGFDIEDVGKYPLTKVPELFFYAFRMHHQNVSRQKTDKILFEDLGGLPEGAIERLGMLYAIPFKALSNKDENAKNSKMTVEM